MILSLCKILNQFPQLPLSTQIDYYSYNLLRRKQFAFDYNKYLNIDWKINLKGTKFKVASNCNDMYLYIAKSFAIFNR